MIARRILSFLFSRIEVGHLSVHWPNGSGREFGVAGDTPRADIQIREPGRVLRDLWREGSVGFAEAYIAGAWTTSDLATLLELAVRNLDRRVTEHESRFRRWRASWARRAGDRGEEAIRVIGDHYNLGNDFYQQWLDPTMSYSSGLFEDLGEALDVAQHRKYARLCEALELRDGDRVLEIGCGWGGFAEYAMTNHDIEYVGITLSEEQATYARKRLGNLGVADRASIAIRDFRDEQGIYDKVVSIEMIESVPDTLWAPLFETIERSLTPGGRAAMQAITIDERFYASLLDRNEFIKAYIFPDGALPSVEVLQSLVSDAGLGWVSMAMHGPSYAETLRRWRESFETAWPDIVRMELGFDERFRRMWHYYLAYCEAGFRTGRIDGIQFAMSKPT